MPKVYLTRRETFSTAHRLHSSYLSDADNMRIFDKCNNPNGHGHNYVLEVTVVGHVDAHTGMVMNIADLKYLIQEHVLKFIDHKHLDKDVDYFRETKTVSTTENLAVFIWQQINTVIDNQFDNIKLHEVKVYETEKNIVVYRGD
ncbi:unnamed protein product [Adineta steineri]|uniref:6-pyruvoyltetrahydropterin synthase n=1 Tax=Adineta steineri TaxID=433720 RepID=A0A815SRY8_9BILA|nr:unnamed protein product [Adineta steineri]CAF3833323.1 unnamed protein product [Adineta steineri]CAF4061398.1 unnamed protein product [Adineta steineri]